ncbi:nuclear transport factor 2 family protein [Streptomyces spiralis]|uniref:nuclear transport factor 2 family protein n=1 Tax=Streptomyces spiralis TaxID=66376 RepID=UPI0033D740FF
MAPPVSGYHAIPNLLARYAELIDTGDFAGVGRLFADATITVEENGLTVSGPAEVQAMYERWTRLYPDNGTPHTRHVTTNPILEVDDEAGTATCRSYVTVFQCTDALPLQPILSGRYHDRFRRVDGVWRFEHRHMINEYTGDLSRHMLQSFGGSVVAH